MWYEPEIAQDCGRCVSAAFLMPQPNSSQTEILKLFLEASVDSHACMSGYYDDLSADESVGGDSSDSEIDETDIQAHIRSMVCSTPSPQKLLAPTVAQKRPRDRETISRVIIHLDIDSFYCQCEKLDRNLADDRPFAIGQKHIIVTCNYAARKMGVGKLESRESAIRKCPSLLILEGSDLERYRVYGRNVYMAFRRACQQLGGKKMAVCKGSMDEMMVDLTHVDFLANTRENGNSLDQVYVYGSRSGEATTLTEDQTGATATVVYDKTASRDTKETRLVRKQYFEAASMALAIQNQILEQTGFTTTLGVSNSPMLAKIASGLRKPATVNILYPWDATELLAGMPLRKVSGFGRRMMYALHPSLESYYGSLIPTARSKSSPCWTCRLVHFPSQHMYRATFGFS